MVKKSKKEKIDRLLKCIDKNLSSPMGSKNYRKAINFNGGEILLEWELIKTVVNHVKKEYPKEKIKFGINTNGTLINEEIARFLVQNFKSIGLSIDGYREAHNKTRIYHNDSGSFDDVIRGLNLLNKYRPKSETAYQGTLIPEHEFRIEKLKEMRKYGFESARLGCDVLGITPKQAKQMAELSFEMSIRSKDYGLWAKDNFFRNYEMILNSKERKKELNFMCNGLNYYGRHLIYNVDKETLKLLCPFVANAEVSLDEINDDIHHPLIYEKGINFLRKRYETFRNICTDCELAAICRGGGCVMTGLDSFNKQNEAACIFQKEMWKRFLIYIGLKEKSRTINKAADSMQSVV